MVKNKLTLFKCLSLLLIPFVTTVQAAKIESPTIAPSRQDVFTDQVVIIGHIQKQLILLEQRVQEPLDKAVLLEQRLNAGQVSSAEILKEIELIEAPLVQFRLELLASIDEIDQLRVHLESEQPETKTEEANEIQDELRMLQEKLQHPLKIIDRLEKRLKEPRGVSTKEELAKTQQMLNDLEQFQKVLMEALDRIDQLQEELEQPSKTDEKNIKEMKRRKS